MVKGNQQGRGKHSEASNIKKLLSPPVLIQLAQEARTEPGKSSSLLSAPWLLVEEYKWYQPVDQPQGIWWQGHIPHPSFFFLLPASYGPNSNVRQSGRKAGLIQSLAVNHLEYRLGWRGMGHRSGETRGGYSAQYLICNCGRLNSGPQTLEYLNVLPYMVNRTLQM